MQNKTSFALQEMGCGVIMGSYQEAHMFIFSNLIHLIGEGPFTVMVPCLKVHPAVFEKAVR